MENGSRKRVLLLLFDEAFSGLRNGKGKSEEDEGRKEG
jgi:hypothetical protein